MRQPFIKGILLSVVQTVSSSGVRSEAGPDSEIGADSESGPRVELTLPGTQTLRTRPPVCGWLGTASSAAGPSTG